MKKDIKCIENLNFFIKVVLILTILFIMIPITLALDKSRVEVGADILNNFGITGKDKNVCLIDDGIDYTNEYLGTCTDNQFINGNCRTIIGGVNIVDNTQNITPNSSQFHGTHIAGIILSNHSTVRGIAPNSKIVGVKIKSNIGNPTTCQSFIDAIKWCSNHSLQ